MGCRTQAAEDAEAYRQLLEAEPVAATQPYDSAAPLSLRRALELAVEHNEQLASRGERYVQSLIDKERAVASFLPTVTFAPAYLRQQRTNIALGQVSAAEFVPPKAFDVPFQSRLSVNLPRDAAVVKASNFRADQQADLLLDLKASLLLDVAQVYYQVLISQRQVDVVHHSIMVQEQRVRDTQTALQAGTARPMDVTQAQAQLAGTRVLLTRTETDIANGRAMLSLLLGVPAVKGELSDQLYVPEDVGTEDELLATASCSRKDLQAARAAIAAADSVLKAAWGEYFPTFSFGSSYFTHRESFPPDVRWMNLVEMQMPLFSAGLIRADIRTAYSRLRQAYLDEAYTRRQAMRDIRVAATDLHSSETQVAQLQAEVVAAQDALSQSELSYKYGLATNLDRLTAQDRLLEAQLDLAREQMARKIYYLTLLRAVGLLEVDSAEPTTKPAEIAEADAKGQPKRQ